MPSIKDKLTVRAIAREYCSNGRNKEQAMRTIGYAESSCKSGKAVKDVYGNLRVSAAIAVIDDKSAEKQQRTIQSIDEMFQKAYDIAKTANQPAAMNGSATGIARLYGLDKDASADKDEQQELDKAKTTEAIALGNIRLRTG